MVRVQYDAARARERTQRKGMARVGRLARSLGRRQKSPEPAAVGKDPMAAGLVRIGERDQSGQSAEEVSRSRRSVSGPEERIAECGQIGIEIVPSFLCSSSQPLGQTAGDRRGHLLHLASGRRRQADEPQDSGRGDRAALKITRPTLDRPAGWMARFRGHGRSAVLRPKRPSETMLRTRGLRLSAPHIILLRASRKTWGE